MLFVFNLIKGYRCFNEQESLPEILRSGLSEEHIIVSNKKTKSSELTYQSNNLDYASLSKMLVHGFQITKFCCCLHWLIPYSQSQEVSACNPSEILTLDTGTHVQCFNTLR